MSDSKILIAYFSRRGENYLNGSIVDLQVGNTEIVAREIAAATGGKLLELRTVRDYPVGYHEATDVAKIELREKARPLLDGAPEHIDGYDVVFVGFPNWWGTAPMAVFTFLESHDFAGKTVVPFCTHEGSGMGRSERDVAAASPGAAVVRGFAVRGGQARSAGGEIRSWLSSLDL